MKKVLRVMVVTFMTVLCLTGCGKEQDELLEYLNGDARKEVTELEKKMKDSYASVTGENYKDDQTALQEFTSNTVDLAKQTLDKATALGGTIEGEELKKAHELYVACIKDFQSGLDQFVQALENGDSEQMTQVNETLGKANEENTQYMDAIKKLADDLGVEVEMKQ